MYRYIYIYVCVYIYTRGCLYITVEGCRLPRRTPVPQHSTPKDLLREHMTSGHYMRGVFTCDFPFKDSLGHAKCQIAKPPFPPSVLQHSALRAEHSGMHLCVSKLIRLSSSLRLGVNGPGFCLCAGLCSNSNQSRVQVASRRQAKWNRPSRCFQLIRAPQLAPEPAPAPPPPPGTSSGPCPRALAAGEKRVCFCPAC